MKSAQQMMDVVDWHSKRVLMGTADDVPAALLGLLSPDSTERERAYWQLDNHIVVQGWLHEAAYFVIPILIQMLREQPSCTKMEIYDLLVQLSVGWGQDGELIKTAEGDEVPLRVACRRELRKGLSVFQRDLGSGDAILEQAVTDLLDDLAEADG